MQKTIKVRGILPPGIDKNSKIVFGIMWLRLGRLQLTDRNADANSSRVLVQFWGEKEPTTLQAENTAAAEYPRMHEYEIRCPVLNFQKYLLDMKNNLRIEVEGRGKISIDFKSLLVRNANHTSKSAFDHFKSNFQVVRNGDKVGTLEIEMASNFNPKILEVEAEQQNLECRNAVDIISVQKPWVLKEFLEAYDKQQQPFQSAISDKRIPNSLNLKPPEQEKFDPQQYRDKEQRKETVPPAREAPELPYPKMTPIEPEENKSFPALEKILTYSNLKLREEEPEVPQRAKADAQPPSIRLQESPKRRVEEDQDQIRRNQQLRREFYGDETPRSQELQDIIASVPKSEEEQPKTILAQPQAQPQITSSRMNAEELPKVIPVAPTNLQPLNMAMISNPPEQARPQHPSERLVLTMYAQIANIKLSYPVGFHVMYKSYGRSDRNRLEYSPKEPMEIVDTVGAHQLKKMDTVPFIVEVWDTRKDALVGLIKINLSKVKQGFLMAGQYINEKAVRANVFPTTVFKGTSEVRGLTNTQTGEAWIQLMIGTSTQINTYRNQPKAQTAAGTETQLQPPPRIPSAEQPKPAGDAIPPMIGSNDQLQLLTEFVEYLRASHTRITAELLRIMSLKELSQEQFAAFLSRINKISFLPLFNLLNYRAKGAFPVQLISDSFDEYNAIWSTIQADKAERQELLNIVLKKEVVEAVEANSQFNLVSREKFIRILSEYSKLSPADMTALMRYHLQEFISTSELRKTLAGQAPRSIEALPRKIIQEEILTQIKQLIRNNDIQPSDVVGQFRQTERVIDLEDLSRLFRAFKVNLSFWKLLLFVDKVKQLMGDDTRSLQEISYASFYNWFSDVRRGTLDNQAQDKKLIAKLRQLLRPAQVPAKEPTRPTIPPAQRVPAQINIQEQSSPEHHDEIPNLGSLVNEIMEERQNQEDESPEQVQPKQLAESRQAELAETVKRWKHNFTIEPVELTLEKPLNGPCVVAYRFPHEDQQIEARQFPLFPDKHRYEVRMVGKHSVVLEDSLAAYIADEVLMFQLKLNGEQFAQAAMPAEEYLIEPGTETKIIGLFGRADEEQAEPQMVGKLRVRVTYSKELSQQNFVGRETTTSLFLPRSGNLNVQVSCSVDMKKLAGELRVKEDFYCSLQFELFPQSKELQHVSKPLHSKLHATLTEVVYLRDSLKLKLTPAIIEYLKSKNCRVTIQAVYYQRVEGVPKKQLLQLGALDIPLLAVVTGKGIQGDYAFKNKYGMFVALAQCNISYGRNNKLQQEDIHAGISESQAQPPSTERIWLLLNFLELLQYGADIKHATFEVFVRKERHTTPRCNVNHQELVSMLKGCNLMIQLTQQELFEMTFLSISVKTNNKEAKLFVEINTRPLLESFQRAKHTAYSGYFAVAEDRKDICPIRVGMKITAFRCTTNKLKDFVNALYQNPQLDVFESLQLPSELDNYPKMVDLLRHGLKMPKVAFEQSLSELLNARERLNIQLFTTRINFRLDLSQLRAQTFDEVIRLLEGCPQTEVAAETVADVLQAEDLHFINFKPEFLSRFTFSQLDSHHLDRNAEMFDIGSLVDALTLVRKIEVLERRSFHRRRENSGDVNNTAGLDNTEEELDDSVEYILRIAVEKGKNIESLYNGIKPNSLVRCPLIDLETEVFERESSPQYNLQTQFQLRARELADFKKLDFEVYHRLTIEGEGSEQILIGHGRVDISSLLFFKGDRKSSVFTVIMSPEKSYMKNVKAELRIVCEIEKTTAEMYSPMRRSRESLQPSGLQPSKNYDMARIARILKEDVRAGKEMLFESSDEDE